MDKQISDIIRSLNTTVSALDIMLKPYSEFVIYGASWTMSLPNPIEI